MTAEKPSPGKRAKISVPDLVDARRTGRKLAVVTAYDATMARLFDEALVDILMVGDSLGMVVMGHRDTLSVTLEHMIYHVKAVSRAEPRAHIVGDLPFMSYQVSPEQALVSAGRLVGEGGAESVKLEGGQVVRESVARIVRAGIPVMGHVGLTPQSVHAMGGFRVQGRTTESARALVADARALEEAGAYAVVVEGVPSDVGQAITEALTIPTIGIGAGPHTSGQVLVGHDLLGMYRGHRPKFVKVFGDVGSAIVDATRAFAEEVRAGTFPGPENQFAATRGSAGGGESPSAKDLPAAELAGTYGPQTEVP
jgi:3-methyl-2-oxobutanoate hydroxymethyltransferase